MALEFSSLPQQLQDSLYFLAPTYDVKLLRSDALRSILTRFNLSHPPSASKGVLLNSFLSDILARRDEIIADMFQRIPSPDVARNTGNLHRTICHASLLDGHKCRNRARAGFSTCSIASHRAQKFDMPKSKDSEQGDLVTKLECSSSKTVSVPSIPFSTKPKVGQSTSMASVNIIGNCSLDCELANLDLSQHDPPAHTETTTKQQQPQNSSLSPPRPIHPYGPSNNDNKNDESNVSDLSSTSPEYPLGRSTSSSSSLVVTMVQKQSILLQIEVLRLVKREIQKQINTLVRLTRSGSLLPPSSILCLLL